MKIYKGNIVPLWDREEKTFLKVKESSEEEIREKWIELLKYLRKYLELIVRIYNKKSLETGKGISSSEVKPVERADLSVIANAIAMFFKTPLYKEVFKGLYLSPFKMLTIFSASKKIIENLSKDERYRLNVYDLENLFESKVLDLLEKDDDIKNLITLLDDDELYKLLIDCYTSIPSDTRPGANTSSLIIHLLSSSALIWPLNENIAKKDIAIFRIASLLHDIGKPLNYERHVDASVKEARKLLSGLILDKDLEKILEKIKSHHEKGNVISLADAKSSSTDRLMKYIRCTIGGDVEKLVREIAEDIDEDPVGWAYGSGREIWEFWKKVEEKYPGKIMELTEKFIEKINSIQSRNVLEQKVEEPEIMDKNILFVKIDLRGIQKYIRSTISLKALSGASLLIEMLIHYLIPYRLIEKYGFPYESILYSGGGNIVIIIPASRISTLNKVMRETLTNIFDGLGYEIGCYNFASDFRTMNLSTELNLVLRKSLARKGERIFKYLGIEDKCQLCGFNPSIDIIPIGERNYRICNLCMRKYNFGKDFGIGRKWNKIEINGRTPKDEFGVEFKYISENIMEIISGANVEDINRRILNYSLISLDGNLVGYFMAKSISLTDMVERSYRCETALKQSYNYAIKTLLDTLHEKDKYKTVFRILLGTIYLGGDDGLIIVPSWIAIPFSIMLGEEFYKNIGGETGLSIGIFTVNAKYPIWLALKNSKQLLKYCKEEEGRKMDDGKLIAKGVVSFYVSEKGNISPGTIVEYLRDARGKMLLSVQPYLLNIDKKEKPLSNSIYHLLYKIGILDGVDDPDKYEKTIKKAYEFYNELKQNGDPELKKLYRIIRDTLVYYDRILNEVSGNYNAIKMVLLFLMRNYCRFSETDKKLSNRYLHILKMMDLHMLKNNLLIDSALLLKTMGGGYL